MFESGAILLYLAEKTGRSCPADRARALEAMQWLFWQVGGLGPMAGQAGYFRVYAPEPVPYRDRALHARARRLYGVLDRRLAGRAFIAGDEYSIADMACYPWIVPHAGARAGPRRRFPRAALVRGHAARPATRRVYDGVVDVYADGLSRGLSADARATLFNHGPDAAAH